MEYNIIPDKEALGKCTWCRKPISDYVEVFGAGVKFRPGVDLSEYAGHCINITLVSDERPIYMLVTLDGSEAKQDGNDGMLLFCSEECGNELKNVLENEISLGKIIESFNFE